MKFFFAVRLKYHAIELLELSKTKCSVALPSNWVKICEKWPSLVRNKVGVDTLNNNNNHNGGTNKYSRTKYLQRHKSFDASSPNYRNYSDASTAIIENNNIRDNSNDGTLVVATKRPQFVRAFSTNQA